MKKLWLIPCCVLYMLLYTNMAYADFWQIVRDSPAREQPAVNATMLGTASKGWIVHAVKQKNASQTWLKVTAVQKHTQDDMIPVQHIYPSHKKVAYIAMTDVSPLPKLQQPTTVHVKLFPKVQEGDLASNGAVNEAALKTALNSWIEQCNAILRKFEGMDPITAEKELIKNLIAWKYDDHRTRFTISAVEDSIMPLLLRWIKQHYGQTECTLDVNDKKILAILAKYGLEPEIGDGNPFLLGDLRNLRKRISVDTPIDAYATYMTLLNTQPNVLFYNGCCRHSLQDMGAWAVQWEQYLNTVPVDSFYFITGNKHYLEFMAYILFNDIPNIPNASHYMQEQVEKTRINELKLIAQKNPNTKTAALITELLDEIAYYDYRLIPTLKQKLYKKIRTLFAPHPNIAKTTPTTTEEKFLGQHTFSLQWIEGNNLGKANIFYTEAGKLHINAKQKYHNDYATLDGEVHILDNNTFIVTGILVTKISQFAGGKSCPRVGEFTFTASQERKFWRLQEMANPCYPVMDYIDVHFKRPH